MQMGFFIASDRRREWFARTSYMTCAVPHAVPSIAATANSESKKNKGRKMNVKKGRIVALLLLLILGV
ncbi:MAG TPA: hypothetical protein DCL69_08005, partial [Firmicutes bacterium]|nr:hypothetical protein [Bacillota bacterium]